MHWYLKQTTWFSMIRANSNSFQRSELGHTPLMNFPKMPSLRAVQSSRNVPWNPHKGESGNFSEYKGIGGIMGYDSRYETGTLACFMRSRLTHFLSFPFQCSCARTTALGTSSRRTTSSPFEKEVFVSFTQKRPQTCLQNAAWKLSASGVRYTPIFSHQRTFHSGRMPLIFA